MFPKMNFKYVRIHGQELAENTMYAKGVFSMCWQLIQNDVMDNLEINRKPDPKRSGFFDGEVYFMNLLSASY